MRIVMVTEEFVPYTPETPTGRNVDALAAQLVKRDIPVHVVMPMPAELDPGEHSLARRLMPIPVAVDGEDMPFGRYDGRTASGVEVHLLKTDVSASSQQIRKGTGIAVAALLNSLDKAGLSVLVWNSCIELPDTDSILANHIAVVDRVDGLDPAIEEKTSIVVHGKLLAGKLSEKMPSIMEKGQVTILPSAARNHNPVSPEDKAAAKVMFQSTYGLPIRPDVPLIYVEIPSYSEKSNTLNDFLTQDVQLVLRGDESNDTFEPFLAQYPDRLVVVPYSTGEDVLMACCDLSVIHSSVEQVVAAMSYGTIPIADASICEGVVDLEPSLNSGSGIIFGESYGKSVVSAFADGVGFYKNQVGFLGVSTRIQKYTASWSQLAETYSNILAFQ